MSAIEDSWNKAEIARRKSLVTTISVVCRDAGFASIQQSALETLVEMLQSYLTELGCSSKTFGELSGRTKPIVTDVTMALIDMGTNVESLPGYSAKYRNVIPSFKPPVKSALTQTPKILSAGEKKSHPSFIPDHLPTFPDVHTYIKTPTHKQLVNEYQAIREKAATQKRDVETSLTKFIAKTGQSQSLFKDETNTFSKAFPLIAVKANPIPYLTGLLPTDNDMEQELTDTQMSEKKRKRTKLSESQEAAEGLEAQQELNISEDMGPDMQDNPFMQPAKFLKARKKSR